MSFDRMPGSAAGPVERRPNMPGIHRDDFDTNNTTFTPPRALQRLQQRVRGHTYSSSASHDSDTISNHSQLTARIRTNSHSDSRPSTVQSVDYGYGQVLGTTRIGGHDNSDPRTQGTPELVSNGILDRGRPIPSMFSTYEAHCPEPRVPGGPSKTNTTKEPVSSNNSDIPQSIRDQALEFVRQSNMRAQSPSNMLEQPPTNSSASILSSLSKQSSAHDAPKERPGFFRRVFGSSTRTNSFPEQQRPTIRDQSTHRAETVAPAVPAKTQTSPTDPPQNVVTKKASFFRRRKKSLTDAPPPPPLPNPVVSASHLQDHPQPVSPGASSLRMVMDRYFGDSDGRLNQTDSNHSKPVDTPAVSRITRSSILSHDTDESSELDMFHSGYTPPPDASIRRVGVEPLEPRANGVRSATSNPQQKHFASPKPDDMERNFGGVNERLQTGISRPNLAQSNSFLSDKSDADESQAPSIVSALSETYHESAGAFSPVSPIANSPMATPAERFVTSPTSDMEREPISPRSHFFEHNRDSLGLPIEGVRAPQSYVVSHDETDLPSLQVDGHTVRPSVEVARGMLGTIDEPTADERERARQIYQGEEQQLLKDEAAPWLGDKNPVSARTLAAYMNLYDFANRNILSGLRTLCDRLVLKGESQQVDRILDAFSRRWDECNPQNGFKGPGVVHAICYALLLLNTDQHMADIQHKMTRSEFIKNTMPAIKSAAESATIRPTRSQRPSLPWSDTTPKSPDDDDRDSIDFRRSTKRLSFRPGMGRFETDPGPGENAELGSMNHLVTRPFDGPEHKWFSEVETVLKAYYNSIVSLALPLHGSQRSKEHAGSSHSPANLTVAGSLRRTGSVISKAPSEGFSYRSKRNNSALSSHWNATTNRSRQKVYPASTVGSTRTSIDDGRSVWSPSAQSSMWSKISMGRTQTTMSVESFAVHPDFKQSLGFTNALSQAIIREESAGDTESVMKIGTVLEDESLELAGAPWAKEGMVKHKHHLDGPEKKAKERSWSETFAVVEKGYLHLFNFNRTTTKINDTRSTKRQPSKTGKAPSVAPSVVGGGNWTDNADETDQFLLRQSLATVLPHPGYSKTRPHVWALSLPTGAVHLFHVGTAEIAEEFVSTVNYWSARLSKEPLVGGVDNIEYGWSDNIIHPALVGNSNGEPLTKPPSRAAGSHAHSASVNSVGKQSMQSTVRGSFDQTFGSRSRLPGDRAHIAEWKPPAASMLPSQLLEIDQLRSLKAYVASVESELERHNELRSAVNLAYTNHYGQNWNKVTGNWEKKSAYLLREVVKFRTYIEALERAGREKERVYEERHAREQERAAIGSKDGKKENVKA